VRIASAHRAPPPPTPPYEDIKREYPTTSDSSAAELTEFLIDRLVDYRAPVRQCSTHDLGTTIANALAERGVNTVVVPTGLDPSWTTDLSADVLTDGVSVVDQLSVSQLDAVDGVMTSCAVAIAETVDLDLGSLTRSRPSGAHAYPGLPPLRGAPRPDLS
jgi:L-lactate dehydrogenase complex protein LldG